MIIYIHGFGSSGFGGKAILFKEYFGKEKVLTPSLSTIPILAIDTLEQLIQLLLYKGEKVNLIGSSLGGFYSIYLANKYNLKAVLINPSIYPYKTLSKVGKAINYYDMSTFESTNVHLDSLKNFEVQNIKDEQNFMLLVQKDDEVLDYKEAVLKLPNAIKYVEEGGNHSFEGIDKYFEKINQFFIQ